MDNNDNDDNIRQPDKVIKEKLIDNDDLYNDDLYNDEYNSIFNDINKNDINNIMNKEIEETLQLSKREFESMYEKQEKQILEIIENERKERIHQFTYIKEKLNKIKSFDKENFSIFETIFTIIEMYENGYIVKYELDKNSYYEIFNLIDNIRLTNKDKEILHKLFVLE